MSGEGRNDMKDHLISRTRFLDALVLDADHKTDLIQVQHALEKAVVRSADRPKMQKANIYTRIWIKFAPQGYVGVEKEKHYELLDGCKYWKSKCEHWIGENEEKARKIRKLEEHFKICETDKEVYQESVNRLANRNVALRDTIDRLQSAYHELVDAYNKMGGVEE